MSIDAVKAMNACVVALCRTRPTVAQTDWGAIELG